MIILLDLMHFSKEFIGCLRNYCHRKQNTRQRGTKMRKVRTSRISNSSPALMFSTGVEQIIGNHMAHAPRFEDQELRSMQRSPGKWAYKGNLFSVLLEQFFLQKC